MSWQSSSVYLIGERLATRFPSTDLLEISVKDVASSLYQAPSVLACALAAVHLHLCVIGFKPPLLELLVDALPIALAHLLGADDGVDGCENEPSTSTFKLDIIQNIEEISLLSCH